ncbi:MAG: hypothetical protein DCC67_03505 [Planctomycetota bacterium]|nr:MAG: hypothetical protein DCC67_03505 [Planctomycetota bacterium]
MYAGADGRQEVVCEGYRIDVVRDGELIEIQHGSLAAIRDKVRRLLTRHRVRVIKPIIADKTLVKLDRRGGQEVERRRSPKHGNLISLFDELVYFTTVFPHERLSLEVPLVNVEERRYPGRGKRRRRTKDAFQLEDQRLLGVVATHTFASAGDLRRMLPARLPSPFHTGQLAGRMNTQRWVAQRIAYCLRQTGVTEVAGKQGNALLYRFAQVQAA